MSPANDDFLDGLADQLEPVRPISGTAVSIGMFGVGIIGMLLVAGTLGLRPDLVSGPVHPMFLFRAATLLVLGGICAATVASMARPGVGRAGKAWMAALAMAGVVPLTALGHALWNPAEAAHAVWWSSAITCLATSLTAAAAFATVLVLHLRRGAPVLPERAGLVTGLASGSLGVLVYTIHCPSNHIAYVGLWYSLAIAIAALACRLIVPRLIRW